MNRKAKEYKRVREELEERLYDLQIWVDKTVGG